MLHRESLRLVAVLLGGLHGLIALLGVGGLHRVSGCEHPEIVACCHQLLPHQDCCHSSSEADEDAGRAAVQAGRDFDDAEHCVICQWYSGAQVPELGDGSSWTAVLVASGMVHDSRLSLPRLGLEQAFPRGPPELALA